MDIATMFCLSTVHTRFCEFWGMFFNLEKLEKVPDTSCSAYAGHHEIDIYVPLPLLGKCTSMKGKKRDL